MSEAVNSQKQPVEQQPAEQLEQPETPSTLEPGLLIFDHPDGAQHGWGDENDPNVGGRLA